MSGPRDTVNGGSSEWVDGRTESVTSWTGHADSRAGGAGHDSDYGSGSGPTSGDDALWLDGTSHD